MLSVPHDILSVVVVVVVVDGLKFKSQLLKNKKGSPEIYIYRKRETIGGSIKIESKLGLKNLKTMNYYNQRQADSTVTTLE